MAFDHIDTWVFDLDNTLYNADRHIFPQMAGRMDAYVARLLDLPPDRAKTVRHDFYQRYGTTLRGLMTEHGVTPDDFLSYVHDFDIAPVPPCDITAQWLRNLHGRKIVFTNAPRDFARRMVDHLQIAPYIEGIFAIEDADHWPKPRPETYDHFLRRHNVAPARAAMLEDMAVNLVPAHDLGMTTVWLHGDGTADDHAHVHHRAARLPDFTVHPYFNRKTAS